MIPSNPLALYIHWPYCQTICPYCNLQKTSAKNVSQDLMAQAYKAQLQFLAVNMKPRPLSSIFFGGGTASLMSADLITTLLTEAHRLFGIQKSTEITMEMHPHHYERLFEFKQLGINRLSLAVEALSDDGLQSLGRPYDVSLAHRAVRQAARHFDTMSCDFIYGRPNQSLLQWQEELKNIIALDCNHLSLYELALDGHSLFSKKQQRGELIPHNDELKRSFYETSHQLMTEHGYHGYEISNYARDGHESRHNLSIWRYDPSIAIGPSGAGRMDCASSSSPRRALRSILHVHGWLEAIKAGHHGYDEWHELSPFETAQEIFLTNLRLREGLSSSRLTDITGLSLKECCDMNELHDLAENKFLTTTSDYDHISLTEDGLMMFDTIIERLLLV